MGLRSTLAICGSALLHAAILTLLSGARAADRVPEAPDVWRGDTVDVEALLTRADEVPKAPAAESQATAAPDKALPTPAQEPSASPKRTPSAAPKAPPEKAAEPIGAAPEPRSEKAKPSSQPDPPPSHTPKPAAAPPAAVGPPAAAEPPQNAGKPTESGGASDLPPGVRRLDKAFVRAITAATHRDPYWRHLPAGPVGVAEVSLSVDADGKLGEISTEPKEVGEAMLHVLTRTHAMLKNGHFALPAGQGAGKISLKIEIGVSDDAPDEDSNDPNAAVTLGFEPPTRARAGRAYFLLASGRRFEAKVTLM